mmetsp:Transcript_27273/g.67269  ORF Transcript_27273/g.67269 Transcript_27273/m.67269 type:complete len:217 (+) Transcript_27273:292-942(+)
MAYPSGMKVRNTPHELHEYPTYVGLRIHVLCELHEQLPPPHVLHDEDVCVLSLDELFRAHAILVHNGLRDPDLFHEQLSLLLIQPRLLDHLQGNALKSHKVLRKQHSRESPRPQHRRRDLEAVVDVVVHGVLAQDEAPVLPLLLLVCVPLVALLLLVVEHVDAEELLPLVHQIVCGARLDGAALDRELPLGPALGHHELGPCEAEGQLLLGVLLDL